MKAIKWAGMTSTQRSWWLYFADSVLTEIREPTEKMVEAALTGTLDEEEAQCAWAAMIDAARKE